MWFTDQNSEPLEIEDNVNLTLIIGRYKKEKFIGRYIKYVKGQRFLLFARKLVINMVKN